MQPEPARCSPLSSWRSGNEPSLQTTATHDLSEYLAWSRSTLGTDWEQDRTRREYEINVASLLNVAQDHEFFVRLPAALAEFGREYNPGKPNQLFLAPPAPRLTPKPYASVVSKSYRYNCLRNRGFPKTAPKGGWCQHSNLYWTLNDIVRTMVVCRYADGPAYLAGRLVEAAEQRGLACESYPLNNDAGYYGHHFYVLLPAYVMTNAEIAAGNLKIEIQITTQLQETMRELTHKLYSEAREREVKPADSKWAFGTPQFKASYLGHTLHFLEGLIVELKRDNEEGSANVQ